MNTRLFTALAVTLASAAPSAAQEVLAHYPFTNASSATCDIAPCSVASPITFGAKTLGQYNEAVLSHNYWLASKQNDSDYKRNYFDIKLTPDAGTRVCLSELSFYVERDDTSVVRSVDIRADEDPGTGGDNFASVLKTVKLPATSSSFKKIKVTIDLSSIGILQDADKAVTLRVHLYGTQVTRYACPTYLDEVSLDGEEKKGNPGGAGCVEMSSYSFTSGSRSSVDGDRNSRSSSISFGRSVDLASKDGRVYTTRLPTSNWVKASAGSNNYEANSMSFDVAPETGLRTSFQELRLMVWRNEYSAFCKIDLRVDNDLGPGGSNFAKVLKRVVLPTGPAAWAEVVIDLSDVPELKDLEKPARLMLNFFGNCNKTTTVHPTYIDDVRLCGSTSNCIRAGVYHLGNAGCQASNAISVSDSPAFGSTIDINIRTNEPNGMYLLFMSVGSGDGSINGPGTNCKIWLNPSRFYLWSKFALDANGNGKVTLPILNQYSNLAGLDIGIQGLLWTPSGDSLSNGTMLRLGCK